MHSIVAHESFKIVTWLKMLLIPDGGLCGLWWLWLITFPLTIVWMVWSSPKMKQGFNTAGGIIACGLPALAILLVFYAPLLYLLLCFLRGIAAVENFTTNPSFGTFFSTVSIVGGVLGILIVVWLIGMIPGCRDAVIKTLEFGATLAGKVWGLRWYSQRNTNPIYQILGASLPAAVINGSFATNLTSDIVTPGVIPGLSAAVGIYFLLFRTVSGQRTAYGDQ